MTVYGAIARLLLIAFRGRGRHVILNTRGIRVDKIVAGGEVVVFELEGED